MRKIFTLLAITAATFGFVSCDNDDDNSAGFTTLTGTIDNMPKDADSYEIKAVLEGSSRTTIATARVAANGSFSIILPSTITGNYLDGQDLDDTGVTVSNPNAKIGYLELHLYGDNDYVDEIVYASVSITTSSVSFSIAYPFYSDSSFTAKGRVEIEEYLFSDVDMTVQEGWNWIVETINETASGSSASTTSKLPTGVKCYLEDDLYDIID